MCSHEHLRTVGHRLFCKDCGSELPLEFLTAGTVQNQPENPADSQGAGKSTPKKTRAKKTEKRGNNQ